MADSGPIAAADPVADDVETASIAQGLPVDLDARRRRARDMGRDLEDLLDDPDAFTAGLRRALLTLADAPYLAELRRVAPGLEIAYGVRSPLLGALARGLRPAIRRARPAEALWLAEHLSRQEELELRLVALALLKRSLPDDPERTWQLLRRLGRRAGEWISVDSLAAVAAEGILREPYRWAEIEQLVYAASPWERRLSAATVAVLRTTGRELAARGEIASRPGAAEVARGLGVVANLIGDAEPAVQKALSWALRELAAIDRVQVEAFVTAEVDRVVATRDGNRAWVLRDALAALDPTVASEHALRLRGLRRRPGGGSTSRAAQVAGRFGRLPAPESLPEPPLR